MDINTWIESLGEKHRTAIEGMEESQIMDYLSDQGLELPDELLDEMAGGVNPFAMLFQAIRRK